MSETKAIPSAIEWPTIKAGDRTFTLRYSYTADYQLARWQRNLASANSIELAAAMAGEFTAPGDWRSAGFERAVDLADLMDPADEKPLIEAVAVAIKNRYPELIVDAPQTPVTNPAQTGSSNSGPSPSLETASASQTNDSGA